VTLGSSFKGLISISPQGGPSLSLSARTYFAPSGGFRREDEGEMPSKSIIIGIHPNLEPLPAEPL